MILAIGIARRMGTAESKAPELCFQSFRDACRVVDRHTVQVLRDGVSQLPVSASIGHCQGRARRCTKVHPREDE